MSKSDSKNENYEPTSEILDLGAIAGSSQSQKGYHKKDGKGHSLGELKELNKKSYSELKPSERKLRDEYNIQLSNTIKQFGTTGIGISSGFQRMWPSLPRFDLPKIDVSKLNQPASAEQQQMANELLGRLANAAEAQNMKRDSDMHSAIQPRFDVKNHILYFANTPIELGNESEQLKFCKKLFRAGSPVKSPVEIGDFYEVLDIEGLSNIQKKKKVYNLKSSLNELVAKTTPTTISNLFIVIDKKIWFNEKYL